LKGLDGILNRQPVISEVPTVEPITKNPELKVMEEEKIALNGEIEELNKK